MRFVLNGKTVDVRAHPMKRLLDVLREDCALTGTKEGCGEGECGACTVLLDGKPVNSCLVPLAHARGARVTTIEGVRNAAALQDAFVREGATQCGICTPGFVIAASALPADASLDDVRTALAGNICRCTGYAAIYRAIRAAQADDNRARRTSKATSRGHTGRKVAGHAGVNARATRPTRAARAPSGAPRRAARRAGSERRRP